MEPQLLADGIMKKPGVDTLLAALHERNIPHCRGDCFRLAAGKKIS